MGGESEWDAGQPGTAWEDILERTLTTVCGGWMLREVLSVLAEETKQ